VLDLHANFTETMAQKSSALISYRENPHTDARKAAAEAALLLDRLMRTGERLATVREQPDLLWPPSGTATDSNPMRALEERAREIEARNPEILVVNVFAGFPFADVPEAGVCFSAVTLGEPEETRAVLKELSELAWSLREEGSHPGMRLEEAMGKLHEHREGPVLIVEPSDNVGAGAPGENTEVLRAFVEHGVPDAGVIINDPEVARSLRTARVGHRTRVLLGGKSGEIGAEPLALEVEVVSKSDGRFELEDPNSHLAARGGKSVDMGPCVVLRSGKAQVLVTSRRTPPFDLGQWRSQGIDPEALFAIGVKAAAGHRRAYDPIARASYTVDVPGPCSENLRRLEFRHVRRPIYPLDDDY
jgi:microcystin degradation protein MlrC